jgi:hypothetical protein
MADLAPAIKGAAGELADIVVAMDAAKKAGGGLRETLEALNPNGNTFRATAAGVMILSDAEARLFDQMRKNKTEWAAWNAARKAGGTEAAAQYFQDYADKVQAAAKAFSPLTEAEAAQKDMETELAQATDDGAAARARQAAANRDAAASYFDLKAAALAAWEAEKKSAAVAGAVQQLRQDEYNSRWAGGLDKVRDAMTGVAGAAQGGLLAAMQALAKAGQALKMPEWLTESLAKVAALMQGYVQMKTRAQEAFHVVGEAARGAAESIASGMADALFDAKRKLIDLESVARGILGMLLSYGIRLGVAALFPTLAPAMGLLGKSMPTGGGMVSGAADKAGPVMPPASGGQVNMVVNVKGVVDVTDPMSIRKLTTAIQTDLRRVNRFNGLGVTA